MKNDKLVRFIQAMEKAREILGEDQAIKWMHGPVPSLGNEIPADILDTESGFQKIEQALQRIKHGACS